MKAVVLAAGAGRRLGTPYPKCMADVGGQSIIRRQMSAFHALGIEQFVIVVGYEQQQLREHLADAGRNITYIINERFLTTNTLYSLYLARPELAGPFFLANADVVFDRRLLDRLIAPTAPAALAIQHVSCGQEEVKVIIREGSIARIGKDLAPSGCHGEFVGVARFEETLTEPLTHALAECMRENNGEMDYFERAIDRLCADHPIAAADVTDLPCCEVDFPADLVKARTRVAPLLVE